MNTTSITNTLHTHNLFEGEQSLNQIRQRTTEVVSKAMRSNGSTLVDAMPAAGKTHSTFDAVADNNLQISYLTERNELYEEAKERSEKRELSHKILPSPHRECPTFKGEHGEDLRKKVRAIYDRGVSGGDIHAEMNLPCEPDCPYSRGWDFEPEDYDVLVGHYNHARVPKVTEDRIVVVDEFPGNNSIQTSKNPAPIVSNFLADRPGLPFDNWTDVIEGRRDDERRHKAFRWFANNGRNVTAEEVIEDDSGDSHTTAGLLFGSLLLMEDLGNGWESTTESTVEPVKGTPWNISRQDIVGKTRCVRDRGNNTMHLLDPPEITEPKSVVGLDGTPCPALWNLAFGRDFSVEKVVPQDMKDSYVHEVLNLNLYEPEFEEGGAKPYYNKRFVTSNKDEAKIFGLKIEYGENPALITTNTALDVYEDKGLMKNVGLYTNYGRIHSSNDFTDENVGMISGSPHPGDDPIKKWCGLQGTGVETEERGENTDFGDLGNAVFHHYVHNEVLQAILRFGRDGSGGEILVNTTATPDWLTTEDMDLPIMSPAGRDIYNTLISTKKPLSQELICSLSGVSQQWVSKILGDFKSRGLVDIEDVPGPKPSLYEWCGKD